MVQAYVLITTALDKVKQAAKNLEKIRGVKSVRVVTGPYDIIAFIEAKKPTTLTSIVGEIRKVKGVINTNTNTAIVREAR